MPHDFQHIALVLDDRDARVFRHLPRGIAQAVVRDDGVGVDYEDDLGCRGALRVSPSFCMEKRG